MRRLRFAWIDDENKKVESFRAAIEGGIGSRGTAHIEYLPVPKNVLEELAIWAKSVARRPPNLIIVDHIFAKSHAFGLKGSSVAHLLRNTLPTTPMVCVTAMLERKSAFDQEDLSEYTAVIGYTDLEEHIETLYAIAQDFRKVVPKGRTVREHTIAALKPPARDKADLLRILPEEFQNQARPTTPHRIASWIYNVLLDRPGFLYDRLNSATLLGLNEKAFDRIKPMFERAMYKGPFASLSRPRWWVSAIRKALFHMVDPSVPDAPQLAGRTLPGITEQDFSVCYVSKKSVPPPDAVALTDATRSAQQRVVRREFAVKHPQDPGTMPGFETRLVLRKGRR